MWRHPECPLLDRRRNVAHASNGVFCIHRNEGDSSICNNVDETWGLTLSEIGQTEEDTYYVISLRVESKPMSSETRSRLLVAGGRGRSGERGEGGY